jgi:hypothetical protein
VFTGGPFSGKKEAIKKVKRRKTDREEEQKLQRN